MATKKVQSEKSLEKWIWDAACAIRGSKDASKFKDYILPLIFVKRLCDVFDDELRTKIKAATLSEGRKKAKLDNSRVRFYIPITPKNPEDDTWSAIRSLSSNIGQELTRIIRAVAASNPLLDDVITRVDYNATTRGEREIDDHQLSNLIEAVSQKRLGLNDVDPDIIGRAYEYLIRKFAENSGKSGGEFFTPPEVGEIMARIMNPEPGMHIYDPTCGSAGLLIKCESVLNDRMQSEGKKVFTPLSLFGQEKETDNWAMAKMNMIIHDMEGDIETGDTFNNPKFKDGHGIKKFDRVVANPMWNQPDFREEVYTDDAYHRFPAGNPGGKADWGWAQHILSSLKDDGRAAVVLDTGAVSRGSGNVGTNKEKDVRKWFIDQDLIEGVLYLPENLFYNTTAPGIILFLNKNKSTKLKDKIFLINASHEFEKGNPKNYISEEQIRKIADAFNAKKLIENFSVFVSKSDVAKNDYNISPSRYIHLGGAEEYVPVEDILNELVEVEMKANEADKRLQKVLKELGF